jgi:TRAP-type C4-dicarboxylate transport system substrate-binding protein
VARFTREAPVGVAAIALVLAACAASPTASVGPTSAALVAGLPSVAPPVAVNPSASSHTVTLELASSESSQSPEATAIDYFASEVARRSGGAVTIVAKAESGDSDQDNIARVTSGQLAMAMVATRGWDDLGVTSMQALETPFLITTQGLAVAATSGDLAEVLMSGLAVKGVRGLALWPIDLRHPVSFGKAFLSPADMKGATIRIVGSTITADVVRALGGNPVLPDVVDDSLLDGVESAFDRTYIFDRKMAFTGNVTYYPRVELLFINDAVFATLSPDQQAAIEAAAVATKEHVLGGIMSEAEQAQRLCADGRGSVALASTAQLADFAAALRPIAASIERDPVAKDLVARIRALPATAPEPAVAAC